MVDQRIKSFWQVAGTFPANKEDVYPQHTIAQEFNKYRGIRVLEYGCGGGSDTLSYLRRGNFVYATDVVPQNIEVAKARVHNAMAAVQSSFLLLDRNDQIPLPDGFIDVASSHGVIHHIATPEPVLTEIVRVLKPGGMLYVMLYTEHLYKRFQPEITKLVREEGITALEAFGWCTDGEGCPYADSYTEAGGTALLSKVGLTVTSTYMYNNDDFRTFRAVKP